jgi:hypothetical protein
MVRYEMANAITRVAFRVGIFELLFVYWIVIGDACEFSRGSFLWRGEHLLIVAATATKINLAPASWRSKMILFHTPHSIAYKPTSAVNTFYFCCLWREN